MRTREVDAVCLGIGGVIGLAALVLGIIMISFYGYYDPNSVDGKLIATTVTEYHTRSGVSYVVQEIFSYPVERNNQTGFANCSRETSRGYAHESSAWGASHGVVLGTTRPPYLPKSRKTTLASTERR
jgi:hypothetical protein